MLKGLVAMFRGIVLLFGAALLLGCVSTPYRVQHDDDLMTLTSGYAKSTVFELNELPKLNSELNKLDELVGEEYFFKASTSFLINYGDYVSPSIIVELTQNNVSALQIESYVVEGESSPLYMFYPILTALSEDMKPLAEILPKYEFNYRDNVLTNEFSVPEGTRYVLVHTKPDFVGMVLSEDGSMRGVGSISTENLGMALLIGLASAGNPALASGMTASYMSGQSNNMHFEFNEFVFANVGLITIL